MSPARRSREVAAVHALPFALAALAAAILAPPLLRALFDGGHVRANYRGRRVAFPLGVLSVAGALAALVPLALVQRLKVAGVFYPQTSAVIVYALGVAFLGLLDDLLGSKPEGGGPRGWRGHARAVAHLQFSTGAMKAVGSLGLALYATGELGLATGHWLLASAVLVLATNVFNLLDLRPGRATKAFVLLAVGLMLGTMRLTPLWTVGLFAGPALVAGSYDLREHAMLGDIGANLLGALAGLWLVLGLSEIGQLLALAILVLVTIYGELRSIGTLVERLPLLRQLDSWGRPT
jgi:UDP-GlcNAc:undecaprenyl-phosphate GlcNAc-1-phosphate transferase